MQSIDAITFGSTMWREGYDMGEVDELLDSLKANTPARNVEIVRQARFTAVRLRKGYDMNDVDAYLEELELHYKQKVGHASITATYHDSTSSVDSTATTAMREKAEAVLAKGYATEDERALAQDMLLLIKDNEKLATIKAVLAS